MSGENEDYKDYWLLGPAFLFLIAIGPLPYEFYMLLRLVSVPLFGILMFHSLLRYRPESSNWYIWMFLGFGLLYNPFVPVYLTKDLWIVFNIVTAVIIATYWYAINNLPENDGEEKDVSLSEVLNPASPMKGEEETTNVLMQMVDQTLRMQAFVSLGVDALSEDDFVSGYIGGYCDAVSQINGKDNNSAEGAALLAVGFLAVYKTEVPIENFLKNQTNSTEIQEGIQVGFQDVMDWLKPSTEASKKTPDGLAKYLLSSNEESAGLDADGGLDIEDAVEQSPSRESVTIESMVATANEYYGKNVDTLLKLLRKNKMHYSDDGGETISVQMKKDEPFYIIFGTDRSEEMPSMTIFGSGIYIGITIFVMGKDTHSWAGSLEPTPASGKGSSTETLFTILVNQHGVRDFNSI